MLITTVNCTFFVDLSILSAKTYTLLESKDTMYANIHTYIYAFSYILVCVCILLNLYH